MALALSVFACRPASRRMLQLRVLDLISIAHMIYQLLRTHRSGHTAQASLHLSVPLDDAQTALDPPVLAEPVHVCSGTAVL